IVTEDNPRTYAALFAEDPWTRGERRYEPGGDAFQGIVALHYGTVLARLRLDLLSAALLEDFTLDESLRVPVAVWVGRHHQVAGRRFIGGISHYPVPSPFPIWGWRRPVQPWDLDAPSATFFGIEENVFR